MAALTKEEKEKARLQFNQYDINKDGKLSFAECAVLIQSALQLDKTVVPARCAGLDVDYNGDISYEEFLKLYELLNEQR